MHRLSTWSTKSKIIMKNLAKLTFAIFVFTLLFTACSKDEDDNTPQVVKEITAEELLEYIIIEEYVPKASAPAEFGDKPILTTTAIKKEIDIDKFFTTVTTPYGPHAVNFLQTIYDANTGITSLETKFGYYDLTRDASGQIVLLKSRHNDNSNLYISSHFDSQYLQLVKRTLSIYDDATYKKISGNGYYRFYSDERKWRYKANARPVYGELTWYYEKLNNNIWYGQDGGTEKYNNLFIIIPKGNGWKGQHKDKDLLLISTMHKDYYKAIGDIGMYEVYDN